VNREKDIAQIRKYINGELNARAMHDLERRALDDPFLADAMEGFEQANTNQQVNLDDLSARLRQRTTKKERRIIPWIPLSIAASILVVIGAGIWFFSSNQSVPQKQLAESIKPEQKKDVALDTVSSTTGGAAVKEDSKAKAEPAQPKAYQKRPGGGAESMAALKEVDDAPVASEPVVRANDAREDDLYKPKKDSLAANELIVKDMNQKKAAAPVAAKEFAITKAKQSAATETLVQSRADGVSVTPGNRTVTGIGMGSDGIPITGATVKILGKPFGVVTDTKGKFTLSDVAKDQTLAVGYIGYNSKKVKVDNQDSINISLEPTNSSLAEVVVSGYSTKKQDDEASTRDAHPKDGWSPFNDYLKTNAHSPDGKTGKVKLSFMVAANGTLSQFKITKSLSDAADKKAIDIITNGPAWVGGTDGKVKEVKVTVSFK
jgi:hypothetical protein